MSKARKAFKYELNQIEAGLEQVRRDAHHRQTLAWEAAEFDRMGLHKHAEMRRQKLAELDDEPAEPAPELAAGDDDEPAEPAPGLAAGDPVDEDSDDARF